MKNIQAGDFVLYKYKDELGLVKEVLPGNKARVYYHMGGTSAVTPLHTVEKIRMIQVFNRTFKNEYAKASLLERQTRLLKGGDISDAIYNKDVLKEIVMFLGKEWFN